MSPTDNLAQLVTLPADLDDAGAAKLLAFFLEAARVIEQHYAGQLLRYYHPPDEPQQPLSLDDPPF